MVRGLRRPWKMSVYYDFDVDATFEFVKKIIDHIAKAGGRVMAETCDMGNTSFLALKESTSFLKENTAFLTLLDPTRWFGSFRMRFT